MKLSSEYLLRGLLVVGGLGLVPLAGEVLLRLRAATSEGPAREVRIHDFAYVDERGVPRFEPYAEGWHRGYGDAAENLVRMNSLGTPGPEPLTDPGRRIVFLGDSITFNGGMPWPESFIGLADSWLRDQGCQRCEVLNFGFSDGNLDHYEKKLEFEVLPLDPDLVYVGVYLNDAIGIEGSPVSTFADELPRRAARHVSPSLFVRWLQRRIGFARAAEAHAVVERAGAEDDGRFVWVPRFHSRRYRQDPQELAPMVEEARNDWGSAWTDVYSTALRASLARMQALTRRQGVPLVVVLFPVSPQVEITEAPELLWLPQRRTAQITTELGLPFIDMLPPLRRAGGHLFRDQCHLNGRGNLVVSNVIAADILRRLGAAR